MLFIHSISGIYTEKFTASNLLFRQNPEVKFWRFQVVYTFDKTNSSSALNFEINQPPEPGECSISPLNGTTSTEFSITCVDWHDNDTIKDYSFYGMLTSYVH